MLTWILGYFWSLPRGVSPRLQLGHARALSSRAVAAVSLFPSRGSRDQGLSLEAFPRGFPTKLSHRDVPPATVVSGDLGLKVEAVQGKQVSLEWTETSGGLGMVARPWSSSRLSRGERSSWDATGMRGILSRPRRERIPPLELGGGNGAPLDVGGTLLLPLKWRRVCRGTS